MEEEAVLAAATGTTPNIQSKPKQKTNYFSR